MEDDWDPNSMCVKHLSLDLNESNLCVENMQEEGKSTLNYNNDNVTAEEDAFHFCRVMLCRALTSYPGDDVSK